jgi:predicted transcriptional regulator
MMKNRRGFLETLRDFLDAMETYPVPNRIMQLANLSRPALLMLIAYGIRNGMIETDQKGARRFYRLTARGMLIRDSLRMIPNIDGRKDELFSVRDKLGTRALDTSEAHG